MSGSRWFSARCASLAEGEGENSEDGASGGDVVEEGSEDGDNAESYEGEEGEEDEMQDILAYIDFSDKEEHEVETITAEDVGDENQLNEMLEEGEKFWLSLTEKEIRLFALQRVLQECSEEQQRKWSTFLEQWAEPGSGLSAEDAPADLQQKLKDAEWLAVDIRRLQRSFAPIPEELEEKFKRMAEPDEDYEEESFPFDTDGFFTEASYIPVGNALKEEAYWTWRTQVQWTKRRLASHYGMSYHRMKVCTLSLADG